MKLARIGLYQLASVTGRHSAYLVELLEQERLPHTALSRLPAPGEFDLLLRAGGPGALSAEERDFVAAGGRLLAFALDEGPEGKGKAFGAGHAAIKGQPLRFFAGSQLRGADLERGSATAAETSAPLVQEFVLGRGRLIHITIDLPDTAVRIQQGVGLAETDRPSAPDGTAETADAILKADDTTTLDWVEDRVRSVTGQPYFPLAHADRWRQWLVEEIVGIVAPRVLLRPAAWPIGAPAVIHLSLDSDDNVAEHAETTLALLDALDVHATWCELEGGYGPQIQARVHAAGHEVALHFNALATEGGVWSHQDFTRQLSQHSRSAPYAPVSNKNHYTRFEGWDEFYDWCTEGGIRLDGSRGPSKMGNRGFLFGTCYPYRPAAFDPNAPRHRVYSLTFQSADIDFEQQRWGDGSVVGPLIDEVLAVGGCLHLLNHQRWLHKCPPVREALAQALRLARARGMATMTAQQIADWIDALRAVRIGVAGNNVAVENLPPDAVLEELSVSGARRVLPAARDGAVQLVS